MSDELYIKVTQASKINGVSRGIPRPLISFHIIEMSLKNFRFHKLAELQIG
jgi:hypothetical protein